MTFDFSKVVFRDMEGNPMSNEDFKAIYRAEKNKLVANVIWRQCPTAEIASICLDILNDRPSEVTPQAMADLRTHVEYAISAYPVKQPILEYIKSINL